MLLMPVEDHPEFIKPNNPNIKIWRYMDFAKYVSLLDTGALFFPRSDKLEDPYEGTVSSASLEELEARFGSATVEDEEPTPSNEIRLRVRNHADRVEVWRQFAYINSWHMNDVESAAMWDLYAQRGQGIAILSTYNKLANNLPKELPSKVFEPSAETPPEYLDKKIIVWAASILIGEVQYVDYDRGLVSTETIQSPFIYKRRSFEHERELRAVIVRPMNIEESGSLVRQPPNAEAGVSVDVSVEDLVEEVVVAPTSPSWFANLVESVSVKYGLDKERIRRSPLYERRMY